MLQFTPKATQHLVRVRQERGLDERNGARLVANGRTIGLTFAAAPGPEDEIIRQPGIAIFLAPEVATTLDGGVVDARIQEGKSCWSCSARSQRRRNREDVIGAASGERSMHWFANGLTASDRSQLRELARMQLDLASPRWVAHEFVFEGVPDAQLAVELLDRPGRSFRVDVAADRRLVTVRADVYQFLDESTIRALRAGV